MARYDLLSFVNFAVQLDKLLQFFYCTGESITIDFYSLMNFIPVFLQNQHKGKKKSTNYCTELWKIFKLNGSFVLTSEMVKSTFKKHVCWTILLLIFFLWKHHC